MFEGTEIDGQQLGQLTRQERERNQLTRERNQLIDKYIDFKALKRDFKTDLFCERKEPRIGMIRDIAFLVLDLEPHLREYQVILSDDAGARLFSLLLKDIIDAKRSEEAASPSQIFFIQGSRDMPLTVEEATRAFINKHIASNTKVLLATEFIASGKSVLPLIHGLQEKGVDYEVATISLSREPQSYPQELRSRLHYTTKGSSGMYFHGKTEYSGVVKNGDINSSHLAHPKRSPETNASELRAARQDVQRLATEMLKLLSHAEKKPESNSFLYIYELPGFSLKELHIKLNGAGYFGPIDAWAFVCYGRINQNIKPDLFRANQIIASLVRNEDMSFINLDKLGPILPILEADYSEMLDKDKSEITKAYLRQTQLLMQSFDKQKGIAA